MGEKTNNLQEAISGAKTTLDEQSEKMQSRTNNHKTKRYGFSPILPVILVLCLILLVFVSDNTQQDIQSDLRTASMDLIMEADANIYFYYQKNGELPDSLPIDALVSVVEYKKISSHEYQLTLGYSDYNKPVTLDILKQTSISDVRATLLND